MKEIEKITYFQENGKWYKRTFYVNTAQPEVEKVETPFVLKDYTDTIIAVLKDDEYCPYSFSFSGKR